MKLKSQMEDNSKYNKRSLNKTYGVFCGGEMQNAFGSGSLKAMKEAVKVMGGLPDGCEISEIKTDNMEKTKKRKRGAARQAPSVTIFGHTIDKFGITCYRLSVETGIPQATLNNWRKGFFRPDPYNDNYKKVVKYVLDKTGVELELSDFVIKK